VQSRYSLLVSVPRVPSHFSHKVICIPSRAGTIRRSHAIEIDDPTIAQHSILVTGSRIAQLSPSSTVQPGQLICTSGTSWFGSNFARNELLSMRRIDAKLLLLSRAKRALATRLTNLPAIKTLAIHFSRRLRNGTLSVRLSDEARARARNLRNSLRPKQIRRVPDLSR